MGPKKPEQSDPFVTPHIVIIPELMPGYDEMADKKKKKKRRNSIGRMFGKLFGKSSKSKSSNKAAPGRFPRSSIVAKNNGLGGDSASMDFSGDFTGEFTKDGTLAAAAAAAAAAAEDYGCSEHFENNNNQRTNGGNPALPTNSPETARQHNAQSNGNSKNVRFSPQAELYYTLRRKDYHKKEKQAAFYQQDEFDTIMSECAQLAIGIMHGPPLVRQHFLNGTYTITEADYYDNEDDLIIHNSPSLMRGLEPLLKMDDSAMYSIQAVICMQEEQISNTQQMDSNALAEHYSKLAYDSRQAAHNMALRDQQLAQGAYGDIANNSTTMKN